jgi:GTP-binding protein
MDLPNAKENLEAFKKKVKDIPIYETSTITGAGLDPILTKLADMLDTIKKAPLYEDEKIESHVLYKFKEELPFLINKEGNTWVIKGDQVEKILRMTKFSTDESIVRFATKLRKLGVDDRLRELGAVEGDNVRILDYEFDYKE